MTLTQRTMCRPLAQVWVVTSSEVLDMLFSTADVGLMVAILHENLPICDIHILTATSPQDGGLRRDQARPMSPMDDGVRRYAGPTLAPNKGAFFTPYLHSATVATIRRPHKNGHEDTMDVTATLTDHWNPQGHRACRARAHFFAAAAVLPR